MWNQTIFLIVLVQLFHVSTGTTEPLEASLWFDRLNDIIRLSKIEEVRDVESDESNSPFYRNLQESDVSINEKRTILSSLKSSSEKRALSMFARWGPINTVGKDRNPIRSGYPPNALDSISTQTRGRMMGQPLRWG